LKALEDLVEERDTGFVQRGCRDWCGQAHGARHVGTRQRKPCKFGASRPIRRDVCTGLQRGDIGEVRVLRQAKDVGYGGNVDSGKGKVMVVRLWRGELALA
jgi:hypothetical protein